MGIFDNLKTTHLESKANKLLKKSQNREALELYNKIIEIGANKRLSVYWNKMVACLRLQKMEEALVCIDKIIEMKPKNSDFYFKKASILSSPKLQRYEESIDVYDKGIKLNNKNSSAYLNKGIVLINLKKYDEAAECFDRAIKLSPNDPWIYCNKALILMKEKKYEEALQLCDKAINIKSKVKFNPDFAYFAKARIYALLNMKDNCIDNFSKAIGMNSMWEKVAKECEDFESFREDILKLL